MTVVLLALLAAPTPARAQVGSGTDIIIGTVKGEDGAPLQDATVEAFSLETQVTRRARTDAHGRFTILFPDGGGQYRMSARYLGLTPHSALLVRDADEDRLIWNIQLSAGAVTLGAVDVRAGPQLRTGEGPTPGSSERAFNPDQLAQLPIDPTDLSVLAGLVPGVLPLAGTDSTAASFSVAGLGADANAVTLDGLLFGNSSVPQEGLRATRVVTSTYDVSRGQFSGGLVASTTRSGSNFVAGATTFQNRDEDLAVDAGDTPYTEGFTQNQFSGGIGGPLIKDRLFLMVSGMARLRSDPQQTLLSAGPADFTRLGVAPDSVARFTSIVNGLGVPYNSVSGLASRASDNYSGLARADVILSPSHTITLRGDWRGTRLDPSRLGALALPQTGGKNVSSGGGLMATFTSHFGATVLNELRGYLQGSRSDGDPFTRLPAGRVQVASLLPDGTTGVTTLTFGGNTGMPTSARSTSFEGSDELSWLPGSGMHRIKLGADFVTEQAHNLLGSNLLGTYTYNSLADLEAGVPAQFTRTLGATERRSDNLRWGMYAGDVWVVTRPFQLTYGVRLEGSAFRDPPAYNAAVDSAFGYRTDRLPTEWRFSPRVGFTWTLGSSSPGGGRAGGGPGGGGFGGGFGGFRGFQPAKYVVRGGIGEFRSQPPANLVAQARSATGLAQSTSGIACIGSSVPAPLWSDYWLSPDSIPSECAGGSTLPGGIQAARAVTLLEPGFEAPRAWRGSLSVERRLTTLLRLTVEGSFARGVAQTGYTDLNLVSRPAFFLTSEAGRPVYLPTAAIAPQTGAGSFNASRADTVFGRVLLARSDLESKQEQLTVGLSGVMGRAIQLQLSYSWQRAWDQQSGARGSTAGDPNVVEWGTSDLQREHSFLLTTTYPVSNALELTAVGRLTSGAPFTPMVGGDVNGDGSRNDRAFIFAPSSGAGASAEAQGMAQLLASASSSVRSCLERQVGTVAGRNSCRGPWQATLDFQLNWRPAVLGLNRRLQLSVVTYNFLRGLDELLHGTNGAHGWGLQTQPDNTLLYVTGFDPAAEQYRYTVNGRFGATYGSATAYRPPFQVGIQLRYTIGPDRVRAALDAMRAGGGRGGFGGPGGGFGGGMGGMIQQGGFRGPVANPTELIARIDSALPNPAAVVLGMKDSLGLDSGQVVLLTLLRDSLAQRNAIVMDSLRAIAQGAGRNADATSLMTLMPRLRPLFEKMRAGVAQDIVSVHAILREDQWAKVPDSVKNFRAGFGGPGRGPGGIRPREMPPDD